MICDLVAEYFLQKVEGKEYVWHKDENYCDDRIENLEWVTNSKLKT
jgi:hypothetical protein